MEKYITGFQHIAIPTSNMQATIDFYESMGFKISEETIFNGTVRVVYLTLKNITIEVRESDVDTPCLNGAIEHISFDVNDIDAVYELCKEKGYKITHGGEIILLFPFLKNGQKCIMLEGPNKECIELAQIL
jgi:catechol 2,3-dioxygenase-like lactoylglutathione lyase family enzyme